MFAFGLLLSFLLVSNRKKIPLSPAVIAPFDGLKISVPSGRGWQTYGKWIYSNTDNTFILQSMLTKSSARIAEVRWQYHIAPEKKPLDEVIRMKIAEGSFTNVRTGNMEIGGIDFTTMIFTSPVPNSRTGIEDNYYAICKLDFGRELTLEVRTRGDGELTKRAFNAAIKGLNYSADPRLAAGNAFIEKLKATGADALVKRETAGTFRRVYLVEKVGRANTVGRDIPASDYSGFTVELFSSVNDLNGRPGINTSAMYFIDGADGWTGKSLFDCDISFDNFYWETKQNALNNRLSSNIVLEYDNGVLRYQGKRFTPSPLSLPEILFDSAAVVFLDSGDGNVLVDLILPDGRIIPAEISKIDPEKNLSTGNINSVIRLTLYHKDENYYEVLFDKDGNITGKTEKTIRTFKLKKSDTKEVIDNFGRWKSDIEEMLRKM